MILRGDNKKGGELDLSSSSRDTTTQSREGRNNTEKRNDLKCLTLTSPVLLEITTQRFTRICSQLRSQSSYLTYQKNVESSDIN